MSSNLTVRQQYAGTSSSQLLLMPLRQCPAFSAPLHTWQLWASGAHRMGLVVPDWKLFTRAPSAPDAMLVFRTCPVGSRFSSSRTYGLWFVVYSVNMLPIQPALLTDHMIYELTDLILELY